MPIIKTNEPQLNNREIGLAMISKPDMVGDPILRLQPDTLLYGPSGVGKTGCACRISDQIAVDAQYPLKTRTLVTDTVSVDFDKTARFSREVLGVYMPSIDLSELTSECRLNIIRNTDSKVISFKTSDPVFGEEKLGDIGLDNWEPFIFDGLRNTAFKNVIFDTLTSYDRVLEHYYRNTLKLRKFALQDERRSKLIQLHIFSRTLGKRCVFTAHSKMPIGIEGGEGDSSQKLSSNMQDRFEALGAGRSSVLADIGTSAAAVYRGNTAGVWPILNMGTVKNPKRVLFPQGTDEWEGKTQLKGLNVDGEEPNIRAIFEKSAKFMAQQQEVK